MQSAGADGPPMKSLMQLCVKLQQNYTCDPTIPMRQRELRRGISDLPASSSLMNLAISKLKYATTSLLWRVLQL